VIIKLPVDFSRVTVILISFSLGLLIDIFSNTFGMHAAACSLLGLIRTPLLERMVDMKEIPEGSIPSYNLFGFGKFLRYVFIIIFVHHISLFLTESFTFFQPLLLIIRIATSIFLTTLIVCIIEAFNFEKKRRGEQ
jgi:rod shape-determining protein MreD